MTSFGSERPSETWLRLGLRPNHHRSVRGLFDCSYEALAQSVQCIPHVSADSLGAMTDWISSDFQVKVGRGGLKFRNRSFPGAGPVATCKERWGVGFDSDLAD